jgi:hypothetical protein
MRKEEIIAHLEKDSKTWAKLSDDAKEESLSDLALIVVLEKEVVE